MPSAAMSDRRVRRPPGPVRPLEHGRQHGHRVGGLTVELGRQADVAVVEADDVEARGRRAARRARSSQCDQLGGEAHHQQQRRVGRREPNVSYSISIAVGSGRVWHAASRVTCPPRRITAAATVPAMTTTTFGVHAGLQHTTPDELRALWRRIEDLGFDWISIWDHFYGATGKPDDAACLEAVAMHAALACATSRGAVRVARVLDRLPPPGGAGQGDHARSTTCPAAGPTWGSAPAGPSIEYDAYGIAFPTAGVAAGPARGGRPVRARPAPRRGHDVRRASTSSSPRRATSRARCRPSCRSGSAAAARSARCASRRSYADGWNVPFVAPETFAAQARRAAPPLRRRRARPGRHPTAPSTSAWRGPRRACAQQFGGARRRSCARAC